MSLILFLLISCGVSKNPLRKEVKLLQKGIIKDDTSYVYALPFEEGKSFRVIQGYFSPFTHKERAALDFNMKKGVKITAARGGIAIRVKEDKPVFKLPTALNICGAGKNINDPLNKLFLTK
ncbi:MAG: hypothetical protein IPL04_01240 [Chitinophagaceae bacterium]|nr:hypothetical protein [Chitinophagaceae bacterium]